MHNNNTAVLSCATEIQTECDARKMIAALKKCNKESQYKYRFSLNSFAFQGFESHFILQSKEEYTEQYFDCDFSLLKNNVYVKQKSNAKSISLKWLAKSSSGLVEHQKLHLDSLDAVQQRVAEWTQGALAAFASVLVVRHRYTLKKNPSITLTFEMAEFEDGDFHTIQTLRGLGDASLLASCKIEELNGDGFFVRGKLMEWMYRYNRPCYKELYSQKDIKILDPSFTLCNCELHSQSKHRSILDDEAFLKFFNRMEYEQFERYPAYQITELTFAPDSLFE